MPGGPASGGTDGWYDCDNLVQRLDAQHGLGSAAAPDGHGDGRGQAAAGQPLVQPRQPGRENTNGCPEFPRERGADGAPNYGAVPRQLCPYATANGATIMDGPVYRYDDAAQDDSRRWPAYWDGRWFLHNHGGASIKHGLLLDPATDQDGGQPVYADSLRNTLSWQGNYMDSKFGPDGALYVQVYDGFFRANPNVGLYRFDYVGGPDTPGPDPQATPAGGRKVAFSIGALGRHRVPWDFGDGGAPRRRTRRTRTRAAGTLRGTLTVTYADGERASKTIDVVVA